MTRTNKTPYGQMHGTGDSFEGFDPETPVAGFYITRLRSGAAFCALRIWYGQPLDPVTGEELDRSLGWNARVNEQDNIDIERVWPKCAADQVSRAKYDALCRKVRWARDNAPSSALAKPFTKSNPLTNNLYF